ncbi:MAG: hypothetical protein R3D44_03660 [Hyphomicrobiaceae bacterium]
MFDRTGVVRKMRQQALIGALIVVGAGLPATAGQLRDDDLKSAVAGKTVTIDTPLGLPITVNYGANGMMTGSTGTALGVYLGAPKDRGRWHVRNGKLCQKWFKWLSGDTTCLTINQEGQKIYWRSDEGQTGTAMIEAGPPALDGVTAAGLGVPPPPAASKVAVPLTAGAAPEVVALPKPKPTPPWPNAKVARETPREADPKAARAVADARQAMRPPRLVRAVAPAARPRYLVASLAPIARPEASQQPAPVVPVATESDGEADPFSVGAERTMRQAADRAAIAALEHRWCLSNAFAKGPAGPDPMPRFTAPELVSAPSLLAVAQEQAYYGELPLHEASCLTEEPAIGQMARLLPTAP